MGIARWFASFAVLGACGSDGGNTPTAKWELITQDQPAALLSVWGNSSTNIWVVGGAPPTGGGPIIEHYDGTTWTKFPITGYDNIDLWWVTGFDDGRVFMGGSQATILSTTDGSSFTKLDPPAGTGNVVVYGIWGSASNNVWAVGGTGASSGFLWRYDGSAWSAYAGTPTEIANGTCWKVNGRSADEVWMSGTLGTVMHWHGGALDTMQIPDAQQQQDDLFSIGSSSKRVVTVGGASTGVLFEDDGGGWTSPLDSVGVLLSGVAVSEDEAYAVGGGGTILHSTSNGNWATEKHGLTIQSLHAAFIDPSGDAWTVGGIFGHPMSGGVLLHKGPALEGSFQ